MYSANRKILYHHETYMAEFAKRADELYGISINCDDAENFVLDLIDNNLLVGLD